MPYLLEVVSDKILTIVKAFSFIYDFQKKIVVFFIISYIKYRVWGSEKCDLMEMD